MISRRQFLFGAAAGAAALSASQSMAGKIASALLTPSPTPTTAPILAADIVTVQDGYGLFGTMREIARNAQYLDRLAQKGHRTDAYMWNRDYDMIVRESVIDLANLIKVSRIKDLEAARLDVHKRCTEIIQNLEHGWYDPVNYDGPLGLMDKFVSRETILAQIPEKSEQTLMALAQAEKTKPPGLQARPVSMDQLHMVLRPHYSPILQNAPTYRGRGNFFAQHTNGFYYTYTPDNLKFLAELQFLHDNNFLSRTFTLPEREQSILDTLEANPANWSQLLKNQSYTPDSANTVNRLNAVFPERAEKAKIYEAVIEREEKIHIPQHGYGLPLIDVPWDIVVEMQDKPDAFLPIMQAVIEESAQHLIKAHRNSLSKSCKGKTTFTQTILNEAGAQSVQGILRGFFDIYPDKTNALDMLRNSFSAAVDLVVKGEDVLLEAKPGMNDQDRLLIEDLSGMKMNQVASAMPLKEPVPVR